MQEPVDMGTAERAEQQKRDKEKKRRSRRNVTSSKSCRHESAAGDFDGTELRYQAGCCGGRPVGITQKGVLSANLATEGRGAALG
jgi:hypothetical protein